jgi:NitT/TauT family transport system substrate-binding protein
MNSRKLLQWAAAVALLTASPAAAQDVLKVAIGQMDTWTNQAPVLGEKAGIFAKHGIRLENFATQGAGETLQAVISGAADIGIGNGTVGVMRAYARGAPIRIIMASHTGAGDFYWYVKSESPINSLKDSAAKNTIAYSTSGASSHNVVLAFIQELGTKATPVATGGQPSTLTAVMSGQIDMGWAAPPFGLREIEEG